MTAHAHSVFSCVCYYCWIIDLTVHVVFVCVCVCQLKSDKCAPLSVNCSLYTEVLPSNFIHACNSGFRVELREQSRISKRGPIA